MHGEGASLLHSHIKVGASMKWWCRQSLFGLRFAPNPKLPAGAAYLGAIYNGKLFEIFPNFQPFETMTHALSKVNNLP